MRIIQQVASYILVKLVISVLIEMSFIGTLSRHDNDANIRLLIATY